MVRLFHALILLFIAICGAAHCESMPSKAVALLKSNEIKAGEELVVRVRFDIKPSWVLKWNRPGQDGFPCRAKWRLPRNFRVREVRVEEDRGHNSHKKEFNLYFVITAPLHLEKHLEIPVSLHLKWLCCGYTCVPHSEVIRFNLVSK